MTKARPSVFISSTCDDLRDLRAELRAALEEEGFDVRVSEDYDSAFKVNPTTNRISTCLENVRESDCLLLLFDRRYGGLLGSDHGNISATELEYKEAVLKGIGVFTFVRDKTFAEWEQWGSRKGDFDPKHVNKEDCDRLFALIDHISQCPETESRSDWIDQFSSSVDLKDKALTRVKEFLGKDYKADRTLEKDRVVRLTFSDFFGGGPWKPDYAQIRFSLSNLGPNVATDIVLRLEAEGEPLDRLSSRWDGLAKGDKTEEIVWRIPRGLRECRLVARYGNLWDDRFEVSAPLKQPKREEAYSKGNEEFRVLEAS